MPDTTASRTSYYGVDDAVLRKLAAHRDYITTRGPGAGTEPSTSAMLQALCRGELVAVGPLDADKWKTMCAVLAAILATFDLRPDERQLLQKMLEQIAAEAQKI